MIDVTTSRDEFGNPVVIARNARAEGRIHILPDGTMALSGDFGNPMPTTLIELVLIAMEKARVTAPPRPVIAADATFTARIVTDESVDPDDRPRQIADVVITADGYGGPPIATYTLHSNPLVPIGNDPADVLAQHGWRMVGVGQLDTDSYLIVRVERA
ncbi:hypothetical protein [Nocardia sp. CY41]|uniref:hypothetical protein n=1 Tax=Nocardia sp. CY41 TaxID=2608686 RepID=UPI00135B331A|nr:hypothetical protein [Nocardia sp. CY41]